MNNPDRLAENLEEEEEEYIPDEVDEEESDDDLEYDSEFESESSVDLEEEMGVTVRTVMGQEFNFMVTLDTTVIDLKMALFVNLNRMHPDTQVLTYQGEEMEEDEETMADYDIQDGATILLQPKLASGFISHPNSVID